MYPIDEPLPSPTNIVNIYLPNDDLRVASNFETSTNDRHDGPHTIMMGPPSQPQLWHDGRFKPIPPPPPTSYDYCFDSLLDAAADEPSSATTNTSFPPPSPYSTTNTSTMSLNAHLHPQVAHHFQPQSVGSMYLSSMQMPMHQHDAAAGTLHSAGAIPDVSSPNVVRELTSDTSMR